MTIFGGSGGNYGDDDPNRFRMPSGGGGGDDGEGTGCGGQAMGWIIFILIFGVGNIILYSTTGIFIIPIRR